jgi:hypothetical protein
MKKRIAKALAVLAVATVAPVVMGATPAHADCQQADRLFALNPANSAVFSANSGCSGAWAIYPAQHTDRVRGQYYVNGDGWLPSSYQWQQVSSTSSPKIIGDTVTDRVLRGEGQTYKQNIHVKY